MLSSTRQFVQTLDAKCIKYTIGSPTDSGQDTMTVSFQGDNMTTICCHFLFDTNDHGVAVRVYDVVKCPQEKLPAMIVTINALNSQYRFAKFCINADDFTVQAEMDAVFRDHDVGEIVHELMARMIIICDEAYLELMKAIWS